MWFKMAVGCITGVILITTTALTTCNGLGCSCTGQDLPSCPPGRNITLFDQDVSFSMDWHGERAINNGGCLNFYSCERANPNPQRKCNALKQKFENYKLFSSCLKNYCNVMPAHNRLCNHQHSVPAIKILCTKKLLKPSCSINLVKTGPGQKGLHFNCTWHKEYFGVNATLHLSPSDRDLEQPCPTGENSLRAGPFSPNIFLNRSSRTNAFCNLALPNVQRKPSCKFSLYITPWNTAINVGESINLTCPQDANEIKWWGIKTKNIISFELNISKVSHRIVTFHAKIPHENGLIIMCMNATSTDKEQVLGIGKIVVKETSTTDNSSSSNTEHPTTTVFSNTTQAWISHSQNGENNTATKQSTIGSGYSTELNSLVMTSARLDTEDVGLIIPLSVAASIALLFSMGICVLLIICRRCKKKTRRRHTKTQQCTNESRKMRVKYGTSHQNPSYDLTVSSESIQFLQMPEIEAIACTKDQLSIARNQNETESAEDAYQSISDDLAPQKFKEKDSIGQNDYELEDVETPGCTTTSNPLTEFYDGMYYTLEDPEEKPVSNGNKICGMKASEELQSKNMDGRHDNSHRNPSTAHHSFDSSENMYFTLEDPKEESVSNINTTSDVNPSRDPRSVGSESKQYENMGSDDLHVYAEVNKTPQSKGTPSPDSHTHNPDSKHYENMDSKDLYAQVNKTSKSMGTPDPDSHSCVSARKHYEKNMDSDDLYAEVDNTSESKGTVLQGSLSTSSTRVYHMEPPKASQDLEDDGDSSTYDRLKRPLYQGSSKS